MLDAAVKVLAAKGLVGASVQDIADAAGMSKGAVHYHFESKDELLEHVLARCCESIEERVRAVFDRDGTPMDRIRRALDEMWAVRRDGVAEVRVMTELHVHARQNPPIRKAFGLQLRKSREQIIEIGLKQFLAMGLKPRVPIEAVPRLIMGVLDGLALQHEVDPLSAEEEADILRAVESLTVALFEV